MSEVKKKFEELRKKYGLPRFDELAKEFEIDSIEKKDFLLRNIRKKVHSKIIAFCELMEEVLQPEANISAIYESGVFNEEEKQKVFDLYKKFMALNREGTEAALKNSEEAGSEYIKKVYKELIGIKAELLPIITKIKEAWQQETSDEEKLGYFG